MRPGNTDPYQEKMAEKVAAAVEKHELAAEDSTTVDATAVSETAEPSVGEMLSAIEKDAEDTRKNDMLKKVIMLLATMVACAAVIAGLWASQWQAAQEPDIEDFEAWVIAQEDAGRTVEPEYADPIYEEVD